MQKCTKPENINIWHKSKKDAYACGCLTKEQKKETEKPKIEIEKPKTEIEKPKIEIEKVIENIIEEKDDREEKDNFVEQNNDHPEKQIHPIIFIFVLILICIGMGFVFFKDEILDRFFKKE